MIPVMMAGLAVGLACSLVAWVKMADRKMVDVEARNLHERNVRTHAFYRSIGEYYYPHRNEDGTTCHYPTV